MKAAKPSLWCLAVLGAFLVGACARSEDLVVTSEELEPPGQVEYRDPNSIGSFASGDERGPSSANDLRCAVRRLEEYVANSRDSREGVGPTDAPMEVLEQSVDLVAAQALLVSLLLMPATALDGEVEQPCDTRSST